MGIRILLEIQCGPMKGLVVLINDGIKIITTHEKAIKAIREAEIKYLERISMLPCSKINR